MHDIWYMNINYMILDSYILYLTSMSNCTQKYIFCKFYEDQKQKGLTFNLFMIVA